MSVISSINIISYAFTWHPVAKLHFYFGTMVGEKWIQMMKDQEYLWYI